VEKAFALTVNCGK